MLPSGIAEQTVVEVIQKGYTMKGTGQEQRSVLRPAKMITVKAEVPG